MKDLKKTIIGLSFLVLIFSCKQKKEAPAQSAKPQSVPIVDVIIAGGSTISNTVEVSGAVIPNETVSINSEISGRLTYLNIPDGGNVSQGSVLAKINDADLQASVSKTKVLLDMAQKTEQRLKKLISINGINQADYDLALNQVNGFKADLAVTQAQIDKTIIKAPFSGVLGLRQVSPGAYVTPATVLTTLQQVDKVKIDFNVPESYTGLIKKGRMVTIQTNEADTKRKAEIVATDPQLNATTRNLKVRAVLNGSSLNPGTFVKVLLDNSSGGNAIMVPTNAIIPDARAKKLIVVKDGMGVFVDIETGFRSAGMVEVTKGIKIGDSVVVTGVLFVRPKLPVKVRSVKKLTE
ncbi:MAG: efflux RND transporter periplasmic adaptor subunit [Sphingobacteriia bacterium]|nr:MAG: efflux RND transporter periplasmic adaptor subunit [Sphingobacteriia bacterium]